VSFLVQPEGVCPVGGEGAVGEAALVEGAGQVDPLVPPQLTRCAELRYAIGTDVGLGLGVVAHVDLQLVRRGRGVGAARLSALHPHPASLQAGQEVVEEGDEAQYHQKVPTEVEIKSTPHAK